MIKTARIIRKKKELEPRVRELLQSCGLLRKSDEHYNPVDFLPTSEHASEKLTKTLKETFVKLLKHSKNLLSDFRQTVQNEVSEIQSAEGMSINESMQFKSVHQDSRLDVQLANQGNQPAKSEHIKDLSQTTLPKTKIEHLAHQEDPEDEEDEMLDFIKEAAQLTLDVPNLSRLHPITAAGKRPASHSNVSPNLDSKKAYSFAKLVMPVLVERIDNKELPATEVFCLFLFFLAEWLSPKAFTESFILLAVYRELLNSQGAQMESVIKEQQREDEAEMDAMKDDLDGLKEDMHEEGSSLDREEDDDGMSRGARSETFHKPNLKYKGHTDELDEMPLPQLSKQVSTNSTQRSHMQKVNRQASLFLLKKPQAPDYCDQHSADVVPDLANKFCTSFLPDIISGKLSQFTVQAKHCSLFGKSKHQKLATIYFTKLLCNWLCYFGYSEANVELDKSSLGQGGLGDGEGDTTGGPAN